MANLLEKFGDELPSVGANALSGFLSGGIGSIFDSLKTDRQVRAQMKLANFQKELNLQELAQSGHAQRQAKRALGVSTAFDGSANTPIPSASVPSAPAGNPIDLTSLASIASSLGQAKQADANVPKIQEEEKNIAEDTRGKKLVNDEIIPEQKDVLVTEKQLNQSRKELTDIEADYRRKEYDWYNNITQSEIDKNLATVEKLSADTQVAVDTLPYTLQEIAAHVAVLYSQQKLNDASAQNAIAQIGVFHAQIVQLKALAKEALSQSSLNEQARRTKQAEFIKLLNDGYKSLQEGKLSAWTLKVESAYSDIPGWEKIEKSTKLLNETLRASSGIIGALAH